MRIETPRLRESEQSACAASCRGVRQDPEAAKSVAFHRKQAVPSDLPVKTPELPDLQRLYAPVVDKQPDGLERLMELLHRYLSAKG